METIREQIAKLPQPYRRMALKYEHDQRWDDPKLSETNWDEEDPVSIAFNGKKTEEGGKFWDAVWNAFHGECNYPAPYNAKFRIGDEVKKVKGYSFDGVVLGSVYNTKGEIRVNVELHHNNMIHIFSEEQLELREV